MDTEVCAYSNKLKFKTALSTEPMAVVKMLTSATITQNIITWNCLIYRFKQILIGNCFHHFVKLVVYPEYYLTGLLEILIEYPCTNTTVTVMQLSCSYVILHK